MPRYYFHIRNGDFLDIDTSGQDLTNIEEAQREALKIINQLLEFWPSGWAEPRQDARVEVANHIGRALLAIPFLDQPPKAVDQGAWSQDRIGASPSAAGSNLRPWAAGIDTADKKAL